VYHAANYLNEEEFKFTHITRKGSPQEDNVTGPFAYLATFSLLAQSHYKCYQSNDFMFYNPH